LSENETKSSAYEKLTPQRKQLVDQVLANLEKGNLFWTQGWVAAGAPESAVTGKKYRGINNLYLSLVAMAENYGDNRWATFRQMEEKGWTFKKDEEGHTLGKGKSVSVEYYEMRDKETKRRFDRSVLDGMTFDEQREYMDKNVYWLRKFYRVFNCSLMDGVPAKEMPTIDVNDRIEKAEAILDYWNANESKIVYGGSQAFYRPSTDEVHLPEREKFKSTQSFYDTAFHEIGHSTGHQSRLNRDLSGGFGSQSYAMEELRAEIASIFMAQDLGIEPSEDRLQNNAAYIQSWKDEIKENPNALFTAIADADKIARYVSSKEQAYRQTKDVEYYAIVEETNAYSEQVYRCYICDEEGKVKPLINYGFADRDALEKELDKIKELDLWKDKTFEEVGIEALKAKSEEKEKAGKVEQEKSTEYIRPSELVAAEVAAKALPVSMDGRGLESLTRMSDRETLSRAETYYGKDGKFSDLYHGKNVLKSEEESEYGLMVRLAMFCGGDQDRLLRVFRSSGQYREEKPNAYYEKMAENSLKFISDTKRSFAPMGEQSGFSKGKQGINSKR
jgi:antirestriction protein ArdC